MSDTMKTEEQGPCPICDHSLRNHTETTCNHCGKCNGATFKARRRHVRLPMPAELELLEPLLNALGYVWSNHYVVPHSPAQAWGEISIKTGHAGRVGMTADEAAEHVVGYAVSRVVRHEGRLREIEDKAAVLKALACQPV